jgi:predicted MFS family arabinose efflux permease
MSSRKKSEWMVVACLFSVLFVGVADNQVLSPLLAAIRARFERASSDMGFLFTGYAFSAGLSVLIWGPLSDAFGRKRGLLSGLLLFAAGSGISALAPGFNALLAGRVVTGMGASMVSLNSISYAGDFFPYQSRGWAMGCIFSSYFAALILGVPLGSWLGDRYSWNAVFACMGSLALLAFAGIYFLLPRLDGQRSSPPEDALATQARKYAGFFRARSSVGALTSSFFASAGTMGFIAFLGVWLSDSFGVPGSKTGLVFLVSGASALMASPLAGSIADRVGKRVQFIASNVSLALLLFILPGMQWGLSLFVVFGLISLSAAFRQGPMEAIFTEIVPSASRGSFVALKNSFSQLGIGLATMLSGTLFESGGYAPVCLLCAFANLLAAGGILLTYRERNL